MSSHIITQSLTSPRTLEAFNAIDKGSLYYLFLSMTQFHTYMAEMSNSMETMFSQIGRTVDTIQEILQLPNGESEEPLNIWGILGVAADLAGAVPGNPAWQGATAAASGVFGLLSELAPTS